ncbi:hypothetical protein FHS27_002894 [Rhodopirellula rubra]|uniref:Uncharacterized protein n=1 Tax=Aporhodopirellula rubra TaxID=980271 RepID=A0A7W5DYY0_9BACT|nr:hypothetical protein [Aporhodopirellula rubra]
MTERERGANAMWRYSAAKKSLQLRLPQEVFAINLIASGGGV